MINRKDEPTQTDELLHLGNKLRTALKYALVTCVAGTTNRMSDVRSKGKFSKELHQKYMYGKFYSKKITTSPDASVRSTWFYCKKNAKVTKHRLRTFQADDPLSDLAAYHLDQFYPELFRTLLLTMEKRVGNCGERSLLVLKYLWEHPEGIDKIEVIRTNDFDHSFVMINRKGNINRPDSWGDAWVIDPWYQETCTLQPKKIRDGIIFHASEFNQRIKQIKQFAIMQENQLNRSGRLPSYQVGKTTLQVSIVIEPKTHLYPSKNPALYPIEYYYQLCLLRYCNMTKKTFSDAYAAHRGRLFNVQRELKDKFGVKDTESPLRTEPRA